MLTHTDLRVPHDRLRVSSVKQMATHNGVAFTAVLRLDGRRVGTIENDGNGGARLLRGQLQPVQLARPGRVRRRLPPPRRRTGIGGDRPGRPGR
jgi:hypothetical protein